MALSSDAKGGYSADVQMRLYVNGHEFNVAQLGPEFIILRVPSDQPAGAAEMSLSIDGRVERWPIYLPNGISAGEAKTRIERARAASDRST